MSVVVSCPTPPKYSSFYFPPCRDECTEKSLYASCNLEAVRRWEWGPAAQSCGAQYFLRSAAQELLAGRWVACVGDSIARNLCAGVMRVLGAPPSAFLFDKHTDFERTIAVEGQDAVKISFTWAPFPQNASETILGWRHEKKPALLVTSVALWHMLYEQDAAMYGQELIRLSEATAEMIPKLSDVAKPVTVLTTGTEVHHERLLTAEKRAAMTSVAVDAYNEALQGAGALAPSGPFGMLDMFAITYGKISINQGVVGERLFQWSLVSYLLGSGLMLALCLKTELGINISLVFFVCRVWYRVQC